MKKNKNDYIKEYLNYYISLKEQPQYAVMLRGKWGSGKSWLIRDYMDSHKEYKYLYVSLNGLTSYQEIEDEFFRQIHPMLAHPGTKLAGKIFGGFIKTAFKIDINSRDSVTVNSTVPDISLPEYLKNIDNRILVFDDLERCSIPLLNILGYINQFVENQDLKVIIIANEDEIIKVDDAKAGNKPYLSVKEKLIGKSFEVNVDFEAGINMFFTEIENKEVSKLLTDKRLLLKTLFTEAGYNNLRHVRQSVLDFERFYGFLSEVAKKPEAMTHIISLFFAISFELKKGELVEDDIFKLFAFDSFLDKDEPITNARKIKNKYTVFGNYGQPINEEIWTDFFKYGSVEKDDLKISIENSKYNKVDNTPDWIKLWRCYDLDDNDFVGLSRRVYAQLKTRQIEDKYSLLHIVCIFISFAEDGLVPYSKIQIVGLGKKNITHLKNIGKLTIGKDEEFPGRSSFGLGYSRLDILETKEFLEYMKNQISIAKIESLPSLGNDLLKLMEESTDKFRDRLTLTNSTENLYYDTPVLKFIPPAKFMKSYLKLSNTDKNYIAIIIKGRYQYPDINNRIMDELSWLKELLEILDKEKIKRKRKISGKIIENLITNSIQPAIEKMETAITINL